MRKLETRNLKGRHVLGLYGDDGGLVCEVKSGAMLGEGLKPIPMELRSIDMATRTATGIFSILGVKDDALDVLEGGSFTKTIDERINQTKKVRFLWNHDQNEPPVATIKSARVLTRAELPQTTQSQFPEATGGVEVTREYHSFPTADAVFKNISTDGLNEMSFGFIAIKYSFEQTETDQPLYMQTRHVQEVKLYEVSDVQWGANPATISVRSLESQLEDWVEFINEIKGRKDISDSDKAALRATVTGLTELLDGKGADVKPDDQEHSEEPTPINIAAEHSLLLAKSQNLIFSME